MKTSKVWLKVIYRAFCPLLNQALIEGPLLTHFGGTVRFLQYCTDVKITPLSQATIDAIEKCQDRIGKFILQIPVSSSCASVHIDAGLPPVWSVVAERVVNYYIKLQDKPNTYWARLALLDNIALGNKSSYTIYLNKWKTKIDAFGIGFDQVSKNAKHYAIRNSMSKWYKTQKSCFAMNPPSHYQWFKPKPWISDSTLSKVYASFRTCNASLGNRAPIGERKVYKLCPLCENNGLVAINNEVSVSMCHSQK